MDHREMSEFARYKGWNIFCPDWAHIAQHPALELGSLCALSVGLHPVLASPDWVLRCAKPYFEGEYDDELFPLEDSEKGIERAKLLDDFLRRFHIAVANLVLTTIRN